jgi:hypothetical protein
MRQKVTFLDNYSSNSINTIRRKQMKKHVLVWILVVLFCLASTLALAGNRAEGNKTGGCGTAAEMDRTQTRDQERSMENMEENDALRERERTESRYQKEPLEENISYLAKDGKRYEWNHRYSKRMNMYENEANQEALNRLLHRIAKRHKFSAEEDVQGFLDWALKHRPWKNI